MQRMKIYRVFIQLYLVYETFVLFFNNAIFYTLFILKCYNFETILHTKNPIYSNMFFKIYTLTAAFVCGIFYSVTKYCIKARRNVLIFKIRCCIRKYLWKLLFPFTGYVLWIKICEFHMQRFISTVEICFFFYS